MYGKPYRRKNCVAERDRQWAADFIGGATLNDLAARTGFARAYVQQRITARLQGVPAMSPAERKRRMGLNSGRPSVWPDCPPNLQREYMRLRKTYEMPAEEARRILESGDQVFAPVAPTRPPWTKAENEELRRRWLAGQSGGEIGKAMNRSRFSVLGRIKRMGLTRANLARKEAA